MEVSNSSRKRSRTEVTGETAEGTRGRGGHFWGQAIPGLCSRRCLGGYPDLRGRLGGSARGTGFAPPKLCLCRTTLGRRSALSCGRQLYGIFSLDC